jgi:alanyl-tRNA synthetase
MAEERQLEVDVEGYQQAMREQRERSRAAGKATGGPTLKFEAEATAHLQTTGVPLTDDQPKCAHAARSAGLLSSVLRPGLLGSRRVPRGAAACCCAQCWSAEQRAQAWPPGIAARPSGSRGMRSTAVPMAPACRAGR